MDSSEKAEQWEMDTKFPTSDIIKKAVEECGRIHLTQDVEVKALRVS
jgi:hypothetical protein